MRFPMPKVNRYIRDMDEVWHGQPSYKEGLVVPEIVLEYGSLLSRIVSLPFYAGHLFGSLREAVRSVRSIRANPYAGNRTVTPDLLAELSGVATKLGISQIGSTRVMESHLFRDSTLLFRNALVFTMEMKKAEIALAPSRRTIHEIFRTYHQLGRAVNLLSDFLRTNGYNAQPIPALSNHLNLSVLARDAGLGWFGKHGLLITGPFGPSVRIAAVLTDIENLPISDSVPHEWIKEFCDSCNACVRRCPAQAIYENPIPLEDGTERHIDYRKCAVPFSKQYGCTVCIKECPFFISGYDRIEKTMVTRRLKAPDVPVWNVAPNRNDSQGIRQNKE